VVYHCRGLKSKKIESGDKPGDATKVTNRKNKLKLWKKVECVRYLDKNDFENDDWRGNDDRDGNETPSKYERRDISLAAFNPNLKQARLYSLHNEATKVKREKTKLVGVACMTLSENGRFACVAFENDECIKVFDLSFRDHRETCQLPFPERLAPKTTGSSYPPPVYLNVSDNGKFVISQSTNRGTLWINGVHPGHVGTRTWKILVLEGGISRSIAARFVANGQVGIDISRVYCESDVDTSLIGFGYHRVSWSGSEQQYTVHFSNAHSFLLRHDEYEGDPKLAVDSIVQSWNMYYSVTAVGINMSQKAGKAPKIVFHDPFCPRAVLVDFGAAFRLSAKTRICDMAWTRDNLFVAVALSDSSVCFVTNSGEPVKVLLSQSGKPKYQLKFRNLESFEEKGKVISHFGISCHPYKAELTWCDGNRNLVHIYLPTQALLVEGHLDRVTPIVSAVRTLAISRKKVHLQGLGVAHDVGKLRGALLAWTLCMNAPVGWSTMEREMTRRCATEVLKNLTVTDPKRLSKYSGDQEGDDYNTVSAFAQLLCLSMRDYRSGGEIAYITRSLVTILIEKQRFYPALHVLRLAEGYFHRSSTSEKRSVLCFDVRFDRHWLLLGVQAMNSANTTKNGYMKSFGEAVMGYALQRAHSWANTRAKLNKKQASRIRLREVGSKLPSFASMSWKGHDLYLRGEYDQAEAAYHDDPVGSFPLMCLLLRRNKLDTALAMARKWWLEAPKTRKGKRAAMGLLGSVMASGFLDEPELSMLPSPCCHPTTRTTRYMDLSKVKAQISTSELMNVHFCALLLFENDDDELGFRVIKETADYRSVLKTIGTERAKNHVSKKQYTFLIQQNLAVKLVCGDIEAVERIVAFVESEFSDGNLAQLVLSMLLMQLNRSNLAAGKVDNFFGVCTNPRDGDRGHSFVRLGKLALSVLWEHCPNCSKEVKPYVFNPEQLKTLPIETHRWVSILKGFLLVFWDITLGRLTCQNELDVFLKKLGQGCDEQVVNSVSLGLLQNSQQPEFMEMVSSVLRENIDEQVTDQISEATTSDVEVDEYSPKPKTVQQVSPGTASSVQSSSATSEDDISWPPSDAVQSPSSVSETSFRLSGTPSTHDTMLTPESSPESSSDSGVEYPSPWVFTAKPDPPVQVAQAATRNELDAVRQQNNELAESIRRLNEKLETVDIGADIRSAVQLLNNKLDKLAMSTPVRTETQRTHESSEDDDFSETETEEMLDSVRESDHQGSTLAARRFLKFASKRKLRKGIEERIKLTPQNYQVQQDIQEDDTFESSDILLAKLPPVIPGVPPLLTIHPATQQSAKMHKFRKKHVVSTHSATQTSIAAGEVAVQSNETERHNIETQTLTTGEITQGSAVDAEANDSLDISEEPKQQPSRDVFAKPFLKLISKRAKGKHVSSDMKDEIDHEAEYASQDNQSVNVRKQPYELKVQGLSSVGGENIPVIVPHVAPNMYLQLDVGGSNYPIGNVSKNQHRGAMRSYLHVADLDENSCGVSRKVPSERKQKSWKPRMRSRVSKKLSRSTKSAGNKFRATFEGEYADHDQLSMADLEDISSKISKIRAF